jgi:dTDP-L-rhamnose 4-epimerase
MKKKILITGGAGFIGSHLAHSLADAGHEVRIFDKFSTQVHGATHARKKALSTDFEVIEGDMRSAGHVYEALKDIDVVYHFAAEVGVGQSMYEISRYVAANCLGTANLLQQLIERRPERLILASSMSVYGEGLYEDEVGYPVGNARRDPVLISRKQWDPVSNDQRSLRPLATPETKRPDLASIYALTKYDQEQMSLIVGKAYNIPTVALRFFNVYGPGQALSNPYTGVIAIFASRLLHGRAPVVYEDGQQRRDFVHVSDVVEACRLAMESPKAAGEIFNVASGVNYSIAEIAEKLAKVMGREGILPEIAQEYRSGDIRHCFADISKARKILGYSPRVSLDEGLANLMNWLATQSSIDRSDQARAELKTRGLAI